jgi:hypothetical protein
MPTAPKLAAAILFGLLGAAVALYLPRVMPAGTPFGMLLPVCAGIFAVTGWRVSGTLAERKPGHGDAMATGLRTASIAALVVLFLFSVAQMIELALRMRYDGPVEALVAIFEEMVKIAPYLADLPFLLMLAAGAALAGLLTGAVGRRWR